MFNETKATGTFITHHGQKFFVRKETETKWLNTKPYYTRNYIINPIQGNYLLYDIDGEYTERLTDWDKCEQMVERIRRMNYFLDKNYKIENDIFECYDGQIYNICTNRLIINLMTEVCSISYRSLQLVKVTHKQALEFMEEQIYPIIKNKIFQKIKNEILKEMVEDRVSKHLNY